MSNSAIQIQPGEQGEQGASANINRIINGQFDIWQRGTSFNSFAVYNADRWHTAGSEDGGIFSSDVNLQTFALGQTDVPGNPNRYVTFQIFITGGGTNASSLFVQRIEDVRTFNGKQVTVSFWAKGDTAGNVAVHFRQAFGTGGSPSAPVEIPGQEILLLNGVWQYYTLTFSVPSITGKTLGTNNDDSLRVRFFTFANAGSSASANLPNPVNFTGTMSLANVQVEEGSLATQFDKKMPGDELIRCQRYYETGHYNESANAQILLTNEKWVNFRVSKRVPATIVATVKTDPPFSTHLLAGYELSSLGSVNGFRVHYAATGGGNGDTSIQFTNPAQTQTEEWAADAEL